MKKILILNDTPWLRNLYRKFLEALGYSVFVASVASKEHDKLMLQNVDLLILDIDTLSENWKLLFHYVKNFQPNVKIIITRESSPEKQSCWIDGADYYHDKAQGLDRLLLEVQKVLGDISPRSGSPVDKVPVGRICR